MTPPTWLDAEGRRRPTRPCWRCGAADPIMRFRLADLRNVVWPPVTTKIVNWCGHSQEYLPWPEAGGWWRLVPVWDAVDRPGNPLERHGLAAP